VLVAVGSIRYLENLAEIGLVDSIKHAKSKGVNIMILYSKEERNDDASTKQLISALKMYGQIKSISGIQGNILLFDNSKLLTIDEEGVEALAVYSDNKFLVKNFGSLLDSLLSETEILESIMVVKDNLAESNKQLAQANEQLKTRDKMQQEFINVAAHELRTPVQPILGLSEVLLSKKGDIEQYKELIDAIKRSAKRLQRLTEDILDITKIESQSLQLRTQRINLNEVILGVIAEYANQIKKVNNVNLSFISKDDTFVNVDRLRLCQVFDNILSNAIKFTEEGNITIAIQRNEESGRDHNNNDYDQVIVSIKDTGTGIDREILPRLFTKFATKSVTGTGLGLFISKSVVEAHGGKIWGENNADGRGATFYFSLPLSK
jgi:two-component system, OmpR family, sensor histidine kinase VicK